MFKKHGNSHKINFSEDIVSYQYTEQFRRHLVEWFHNEKRDLPWRHTTDPYKIWVSEVMLQQTRVDTVIPFYERFIKKYPTMEELAYSEEEELLKMWEGLGYYSRARNLQAGVKEVVEKYGGVVPNNRHDLSKLKGIGPYTAGAILSIAYNKPEHAVDGNVMRVLSRVLHIQEDIALPKTKKVFEKAVTELIDPNDPSAFNQGIMDLGAQICTPTSPKCLLCPVRDYCISFFEGDQDKLPVKTKKTKSKIEKYNIYVALDDKGNVLLEKRPKEGLLANMWQFPMVKLKDDFEKDYNVQMTMKQQSFFKLKHIFSHLTWEMDCHIVNAKQHGELRENTKWLPLNKIHELPMPVPMLKILNAFIE